MSSPWYDAAIITSTAIFNNKKEEEKEHLSIPPFGFSSSVVIIETDV